MNKQELVAMLGQRGIKTFGNKVRVSDVKKAIAASDDLSFSTEVELEAYDLKELQGAKIKVLVKWSVDIEARAWGIKDFSVHCPDQEVEITNWEDDDDEPGNPPENGKIKIANVSVDTSGFKLEKGSLSPFELSEFKGKWELKF